MDNLSKELDLQISGAEQPTVWRLLGVRFILLPYTLGKVRSTVFPRCIPSPLWFNILHLRVLFSFWF